ncbi:tetratricopeptide repeat protein [Neorhodopirellula pilleata]|uniref:tetratricopeptide repeat protein n=1 Tax=Neorhodopirellula pilleata TaxID=2714738 RepID=UPI001E2BEC9A|nr:hypothetical protein [Neorhodopirellula pilleata]
MNPIKWFKWSGEFVYFWGVSIPWRCVSAGLPAIILTSGLLVLTFLAYSDGGSWRRNLLTEQLNDAFETEDFETAELLIRRRIAEGDDSGEMVYKLAVARYQQDQKDEAIGLMRQLAELRQSDEAAMWLVKELYLGRKWTDLDPTGQTEFGRLLKLLSEERPSDLAIKQLYVDYLIASDRFDAAIPYLRELSASQPMRGLQAAALARRIGNEELAVRLANQTLERVDEMFREEPANPALALAVVQNQIFLERHADAIRNLNQAIPRMKTDEHRRVLQQAMGDTIAAWVTLIEQQKNETPMERLKVLKMLQVALEYAPNNPRVLTLVADQVLKTINHDDDKIQALRDALVAGTSPGISHFVRGTAALLDNDPDKATRHLTLAAEHLPNSAAIMNNLAVSIAQREGGDLEHALSLSEQAIAAVSQPSPYFYETRGQILFQMERYLDAIPDLERALPVDELAGKAHETLAVCYEKLDEPELASDHKAAAAKRRLVDAAQ